MSSLMEETVIRILSIDQGAETVIRIAGRLDAGHLAELEEHCARAAKMVIFDLSELQSADEAGIQWLSDRAKQGTLVTGASPYIALRLELRKVTADAKTRLESRLQQ